MAITIAANANSTRISEFLEGKSFEFLEKKLLPVAKWDLPLIVADSQALIDAKFYSYLSPEVKAFGMEDISISSRGNSQIDRVLINGASIMSLFIKAYREGTYKYFAHNSVVLKVKDTFKYTEPSNMTLFNNWVKTNHYCYELKLPPAQSGQLYTIMQRQLCSYFNVTVTKEKRRIKCFVLTRIGNSSLLNTKGGEFDTNSSSENKGLFVYFKNAPFSQFAWSLEYIFASNTGTLPFVDRTGITSKIDLEVPAEAWDDLPDYAALNKALKKYGLRIVEKFCLNDVLVIRENDLKN
jgi:uncharacterized protein (TIGR03435 family)